MKYRLIFCSFNSKEKEYDISQVREVVQLTNNNLYFYPDQRLHQDPEGRVWEVRYFDLVNNTEVEGQYDLIGVLQCQDDPGNRVPSKGYAEFQSLLKAGEWKQKTLLYLKMVKIVFSIRYTN